MTSPATVAEQFAARLRREHPREVEDLILFGSVARGTTHDASDIDVLVIWRGDHAQGLDRAADVAFDHLLDTGHYVSVKVLTPREFAEGRRLHHPFVEAVLADGRSLA